MIVNRYKGIIFDFGETLVDGFDIHAAETMRCIFDAADNKDEEKWMEFVDIFKKALSEMDTARKSDIEFPVDAVVNLVYAITGLYTTMKSEDLEWEFYHAAFPETKPIDGVIDVLETLYNMEIPMGIVSNAAFRVGTFNKKVKQFGMDKYFKYIISSADFGIRKPNKMIFKAGAAMLNLPVEDILFIGDRPLIDVEGAVNAGMGGLLINTHDREFPDGMNVINGWDEFMDFFCGE